MRKPVPVLSVFATVLAVMAAGSQVTAGSHAAKTAPNGQLAVRDKVLPGKTFKLVNRLRFPVQVRIDGDGPSYPIVVTVPPRPAPGVPVPYPNATMSIKVKKPGRDWSRTYRLKWKSGDIALPAF